MPPTTAPFENVAWLSVNTADLHGLLWRDQQRERPLHRLPAAAKSWISAMGWDRGTQTAGLWVEWETDARELFACWTLAHELKQAPGETRIAAAGLDCYGLSAQQRWRFVGQADCWKTPTSDAAFTKLALDGRPRRYRAYLPLSSELLDLHIGCRGGTYAQLVAPALSRAPIIIYGTSIVHGCYASRPGMAFPAQLGRRLATPVINVGLAGSAVLEIGMAELLAQEPAACYVVDSLPNDELDLIRSHYLPFIRHLRTTRPDVPVMLVNNPLEANYAFSPERRRDDNRSNSVWRQALAPLLAEGDERVFLLDGATLLGDDGDGTVDPIHPNDLGMKRIADAYHDCLHRVLGADA